MDNNLVGSPEEVLEKVEFLHDAGADHLACITFCVGSVAEYFEQLEAFAEQVIAPYRAAHGASASPRGGLSAEGGVGVAGE